MYTPVDPTDFSDAALTRGQVIRWWEIRRLLYNAALLFVGVLSVAGMEWLMSKAIPLGEDAIEPLALIFVAIVFAVVANILYTFGWIAELSGHKADFAYARQRGERMFRAGLFVSCGMVSLPFWFACVYWLVHHKQTH